MKKSILIVSIILVIVGLVSASSFFPFNLIPTIIGGYGIGRVMRKYREDRGW
jgi:hypothetical protein